MMTFLRDTLKKAVRRHHLPANRGVAPLGSTMGSAEGGAAPKDGERGWESTAAAGAAAAEAKPADTPTAEVLLVFWWRVAGSGRAMVR